MTRIGVILPSGCHATKLTGSSTLTTISSWGVGHTPNNGLYRYELQDSVRFLRSIDLEME